MPKYVIGISSVVAHVPLCCCGNVSVGGLWWWYGGAHVVPHPPCPYCCCAPWNILATALIICIIGSMPSPLPPFCHPPPFFPPFPLAGVDPMVNPFPPLITMPLQQLLAPAPTTPGYSIWVPCLALSRCFVLCSVVSMPSFLGFLRRSRCLFLLLSCLFFLASFASSFAASFASSFALPCRECHAFHNAIPLCPPSVTVLPLCHCCVGLCCAL